jgi:phytoene dehydrogenase-like protein
MYSPMLQRHIALGRVPLDRATPGSRVKLELPVNHRYEYFDAVVNRIAEFAPDLPSKILHRNVQTPLDIERTTGLTEGNIFQGELTLEQLFFNRPVPGYARFKTPIRDLWLCGSSTHPGGGIMGANGRIAALDVIRARGRGRAA